MRICPTCPSTIIEPYSTDLRIAVDLCGKCRGLFLERDELQTLLAGAPGLQQITEPMPIDVGFRNSLQCPACHHDMTDRAIRGEQDASVWLCPGCNGTWLKAGVLSRLKETIDAQRAYAPRPPAHEKLDALSDVDEGRLAYGRIGFGGPFASLGALPLVFVIAFLFHRTSLGGMLAWLIGMPFHELGHAIVAWLSSQLAIPLPFVTLQVYGKSWYVGLLVATILLYAMWHGWRERRWFVVVIGGVLLLTQAWLTFFVPGLRLAIWQALAGQLGEIALSAFVVVAFYFRLPDRVRWDFWRWPALIPAAICLLRARHVWARASKNLADIPWGAAIGADDDGDMNRLVREYGWDAPELASFYGTATYVALGVVAVVYIYFAVRYVRARSEKR